MNTPATWRELSDLGDSYRVTLEMLVWEPDRDFIERPRRFVWRGRAGCAIKAIHMAIESLNAEFGAHSARVETVEYISLYLAGGPNE